MSCALRQVRIYTDIVVHNSDWSVLFVCLQQCGGHGKEVDYSWTRQTAMKQGYEVKF